jgi:ubiquinone/menaquinone biosynthesis C-methylase UbiE
VFYRHAQEYALVSLLNQAGLDLENMRLLDLGCGTGGLLRFLTNLGANPGRLQGVDLLDYRVKQARSLCNQETGICMGDGGALPYQSQVFDLVSQFTVFSSILDEELRREAAAEITRVMKPGGYLLWYDMPSEACSFPRWKACSHASRCVPCAGCMPFIPPGCCGAHGS